MDMDGVRIVWRDGSLDGRNLRNGALTTLAIGMLLSPLWVAGCVSVQATELGVQQRRTPIPVSSVAVYRTADQVPVPYFELALLDAMGESITTSDPRMYLAMRKKAASLGANGVVLESFTPESVSSRFVGAWAGIPSMRRGKAIAIVVGDDPGDNEAGGGS